MKIKVERLKFQLQIHATFILAKLIIFMINRSNLFFIYFIKNRTTSLLLGLLKPHYNLCKDHFLLQVFSNHRSQ